MYKKILITGGTSSIGYAINLISKNYTFDFTLANSQTCNLLNPDVTNEYFEYISPDAVIHTAAISCGIGQKPNHASILTDNTLMNINVLNACVKNNVKKVILTLSNSIYPDSSLIPIKEESASEGDPHISNIGYSYSKKLLIPLIKTFRDEHELNAIGLVPNGIIGEGINFKPESSVMLAGLIRRFYENKNETLTVFGDGSPIREYTYNIDLAKIYLWCLLYYNSEDILNIGSMEQYTIAEYAFMIADYLNIDKKNIQFDVNKKNGVHQRTTDNSKFINLSHFVYTPLNKALKNTIDWFVENYNKSCIIRL